MVFGKRCPGPGRLHVARFGDLWEYISFSKLFQHFVGRPAALPFGLLFAVKCLPNPSSYHVLKICSYGDFCDAGFQPPNVLAIP